MTEPAALRDLERISASLDDELSQAEKARLELNLKQDSRLEGLQTELSQVRGLLRKLPARRAPRNFMLTPKMAGVRPPLPRAFPFFRMVSALAALLFFFVYAANISAPAFNSVRSAAPAPFLAMGEAADANPPAMQAAAAPQAEAVSEQTATPELGRMAPAPVQSTELSSETAILPSETQSVELPRAADVPGQPEAGVEPGSLAKIMPAGPEQTQAAVIPAPIRPAGPVALQFGLLGLAVVSGGAAYILRIRFEGRWFLARSIKPAGFGLRQVIIIVLVLFLITGLAVSIFYFSNLPG